MWALTIADEGHMSFECRVRCFDIALEGYVASSGVQFHSVPEDFNMMIFIQVLLSLMCAWAVKDNDEIKKKKGGGKELG